MASLSASPEPTWEINPWFIRIPILFISGVVLLLMLLVILIGMFRFTYADRITPGITIFGQDVGGMSRQEAITTLSNRFTYDDATQFTLTYEGRAWQLTAGELGLSFDVAATVDQAIAISHNDDLVRDLMQQADIWFRGQAVVPIIRYDQNIAVNRLMTIAQEINQEPINAQLIIDGTSVMTTLGQMGRTLDITATLAQLDSYILSLAPGGEIPLIVNETPPLMWNAEEAANQIRAALSAPLQLVATGSNGETLGPWTISVEQIGALLQIDLQEASDGTMHYVPSVDLSVFSPYLEQLAPGLITLPQDARFHFDENTRQLVVLRPAVYGRTLNVEATIDALEQAVFRYDNRTVPMVFDATPPRYHEGITAAELGITELVAEATTYYTGSSENRRHNIAHGAAKFDGLILAPGEEFSFNHYLGDISLEAGFKEGKVIVGGSTVNGVGGGICQVSTTLFRAALNGGYWITERNTHAYRVGYYELGGAPPGLDAAIWSPERDFRFLNDTPYHLLIEVSVYPANDALQFRFYSTNPGRTVEILEPTITNVVPAPAPRFVVNSDLQLGQSLQVDYAAEGADVVIVRRVTDANGETRIDRVFTHYLPWQAVFEVAPGDPRLATNGG
ncbi:MAG: VanW family protein [Phototrophicales bacterium]